MIRFVATGGARLLMKAACVLAIATIAILGGGSRAARAQTFSGETAWSDGTNFYYKANFTGSYAHFNVYLDTDNSASTGYAISGTGADYLIEDTTLYKSTVNGGWGWNSVASATETSGSGTVQFAVPLTALGSPSSAKVVFQGADASWNTTTDPTIVTYGGGASYYVSTTGSDSNAGTIGSPWRTLQHAANVATAGATIYARAGTYSPFDINVSGSASAGYITFMNYPGETAVIDGTGWSASYDHGLIHLSNRSYVKIAGFEIRNGSSTSTTSSPVGVMVEGTGNHIQILNNKIHNITNTAGSNGNAHGILVRGNSSSGDIDNITISGNEVYSLRTGWSESVTLAGNVTTFTVSNNTIHDNNNIGLDLQGGYGASPLVDQVRNGEVSGNIVYNCSTLHNTYYNTYSCAGLYADGAASIVMEANLVHHCDIGIEAASEISGKLSSYITVRSNIVYANAMSGIKIGGYQASGTGGTDHCTFVNNTLYADDTNNWWVGEINIGWRATNNLFENNILYAGSQDVFVADVATDGAGVGTFDYNEYYSTGGLSNAKWRWIGQSSWTYTFAAWRSASGQDAHGFFGDPLFVSTSAPNFNISWSSPARNTGNNLGSSIVGTFDYAGNARTSGGAIDMGAYQD